MTAPVRLLDADATLARLDPATAVDALEAALRDGLEPEADPPRVTVPAGPGELLLMPSVGGAIGVKLATVAPANPERGLPRIQGAYVLFDPSTLAPVAVLDAAALTQVRTAAVSALAIRHLAPPGAARLVVYGTGPQAWAHVEAIRAQRPIERVDAAGRDPARLDAFLARCRGAGLDAAALEDGALRHADLVCCATTAREPLFEGGVVAEGATVVAVGSHEPTAREVDDGLARRAFVVVEARSAALREAGDVIAAIDAGALRPEDLHPLAALVRGEVARPAGRPALFKSVGMAWEDAVLAAAAVARDD
jgi:ornithine cyclodeaminase/alanine dehydrogenase-like protein (mu-crystallin family)